MPCGYSRPYAMAHMQNAPSYILGIALVVLLLLIAFSSGTEVAMLSANRYKIRAAAKAGKRTAKALDALLSGQTAGWAPLVLLLLRPSRPRRLHLLAQRLPTTRDPASPWRRGRSYMIERLRAGDRKKYAAQARIRASSSTYNKRRWSCDDADPPALGEQAAYGFLRFRRETGEQSGRPGSPDELHAVVARAAP